MPKTQKFKKLLRAVRKQYVGKKVPKLYQKVYGKIYSKKEAERIAYAIARRRGWRI